MNMTSGRFDKGVRTFMKRQRRKIRLAKRGGGTSHGARRAWLFK